MNRSLPNDRLYDRLMLQLVGTAGTVGKIKAKNLSTRVAYNLYR